MLRGRSDFISLSSGTTKNCIPTFSVRVLWENSLGSRQKRRTQSGQPDPLLRPSSLFVLTSNSPHTEVPGLSSGVTTSESSSDLENTTARSSRRKTSHLKDVPETLELRESLRARCEEVAARLDPDVPVNKDEMERIARATLAEADLPESYLGWTMVMISNAPTGKVRCRPYLPKDASSFCHIASSMRKAAPLTTISLA